MAGLEAFGIVGYECERNCRPSAESNSFGLCRDARLLQIESLKYNNKMKRIVGNEFGGERPLFASCDLCLEETALDYYYDEILGGYDGESAGEVWDGMDD